MSNMEHKQFIALLDKGIAGTDYAGMPVTVLAIGTRKALLMVEPFKDALDWFTDTELPELGTDMSLEERDKALFCICQDEPTFDNPDGKILYLFDKENVTLNDKALQTMINNLVLDFTTEKKTKEQDARAAALSHFNRNIHGEPK